MTGLLVSVRNPAEAIEALEAGADLIDLKEPDRGSLGSVSTGVMDEVVRRIAGRAPVSAALGELIVDAHETAARLPAALAFAKVGLAGCALRDDWPRLWQSTISRLPVGVAPVAVVYADWQRVHAPSPAEVLKRAIEVGCRAVLVDTCSKTAGGLTDHWTGVEVAQLVSRVHKLGMLCVLGGGLTADVIPQLLPLEPDWIAVRGAVCQGSRRGPLDGRLVSRLRELLLAHTI
jgi:(5-formylfuran-3-yl)methyl phosphate synthase